jgi:Flp pilus assembly protein TadB
LTDLITPVIFVAFGSLALVVILGFALLVRNASRPRYEREDHFYRKRERKAPQPSYSSRFDQPNYRAGAYSATSAESRKLLMLVVLVAIIGISISIIFNTFIGLLLIFALPVILNFYRARSEAQRRRNRTGNEDGSA